MSTKRKNTQTRFKTSFYFQVLLIYMELIFHIVACHKGFFSLICAILFAVPLGMLLGIVTSFFEKRINWLLTQALTVVLAVVFLIRIFTTIKFGGFLPVLGIILSIVLLALPCLFIIRYGRKLLSYRRYRQEKQLSTLIVALVILAIVGIISFAGSHIGKSKSNETKKEKTTTSVSSSSTETVQKTGPNVMDVDFDSILTTSSGSDDADDIASIVDYFQNASSTERNDYTGMFEGYNVVFVTAENFSKYAVTEERTPTLYKMLNNGFVFNNYYAQNFVSNATGNEYALTNSMVPGSSVREALGEISTLDRDMYFSLEDQLGRLGYKINTYDDTQYDDFVFDVTSSSSDSSADTDATDSADTSDTADTADDSGNTTSGSSSTASMVAQTAGDYIGDSQFYTSYKVNAGISSYDYESTNIFADELEELDYSDSTKAYLAYQMALDQQMQELLSSLESAGIADKTLIVIAPNPSGTSTQSILEELSGQDMTSTLALRSNSLIVYSASMTSPVNVDKYCSSLDVLPTLSNLLGLEYDSRMMMGKDVFASSSQLVMFPESNGYSFITEDYIYDSEADQSISLGGETETIDSDTVESMNTSLSEMSSISNLVFATDFYRYIDPDVDMSLETDDSALSDETDTDSGSNDEENLNESGTADDSDDASGGTLSDDNTGTQNE